MPEPKSQQDIDAAIESIVLKVHHRNGGRNIALDLSLPLLDASLCLDSMDLAEIVVTIERRLGCAVFDAPSPPRTWRDVIVYVQESTT